jgi:peptide-methionine (S)-S-oxide reductase
MNLHASLILFRAALRASAFAACLFAIAACTSGESRPVEGSPGAASEATQEDTAPDSPAEATKPATAGTPMSDSSTAPPTTDDPLEEDVVTLGAGCFWCIEAVFEQIDGVDSVVSGYMGGQTDNPTYADICTGQTGHAEVVQVTFDPSVVTFDELLDWFWRLHDPTTLNRQGPDSGTQYRSAIFYRSDDQKQSAEASIKSAQPSFRDPIVTEVTAASTFYSAEKYHQGYYGDNAQQGYCQTIIKPKLKKLGLRY